MGLTLTLARTLALTLTLTRPLTFIPNPNANPSLASHHGGASQPGAPLSAAREAGGAISGCEIADLDLARLSWAADDEGRVCRALALAF